MPKFRIKKLEDNKQPVSVVRSIRLPIELDIYIEAQIKATGVDRSKIVKQMIEFCIQNTARR